MAVPFRLANASLVERVARFAEISWTDEGSGRELLARLALSPPPYFCPTVFAGMILQSCWWKRRMPGIRVVVQRPHVSPAGEPQAAGLG